ncbi:hypothetical protein ABE424_04195 [Stenotrophomonas sp. TWI1149]|jgi:hypothetical protein|uniref:hypothetical protein n=1 Tax=unclassified Stenotrophomonas TaxID=196198 RepID=UPI00320859DA
MAFPLYCSITASVYPGVLIWMLDESRGIQYTKSADPDSTLGKTGQPWLRCMNLM